MQGSQNSQSNLAAILVINCGSSSLKFSLIEPSTGLTLLSGLAECLTTPEATFKIKQFNNDATQLNSETKALTSPYEHQQALQLLVSKLETLQLVDRISAVGHRVVHGGERYALPTLVDQEVKNDIKGLAKLAPLHNLANLIGIEACENAFPHLAQVVVFDTAFHQSMPAKAYLYGVPYELYTEQYIRRYGFHGTSHYFVTNQAAKLINKPILECNFISAHLGNGCSITAIKNGQSVDTSMGLTPLEGVVMGTRSGDVDAGVIFHLVDQLGYSIKEVDALLNKQSGLLGLSQLSNDCRSLESAMEDAANPKSEQAKLALSVFCYRIAKKIASYSACLESLDGLIFTGGIGENSAWVRQQVLQQLSLLNFYVCEEANLSARFGKTGNIASESSRPCWVIPTNEELVIAQQSQALLNNANVRH